jgi:hypothetical protein
LLALPKAMLALVYYEHPDALAETGYDGKPLVSAPPVALAIPPPKEGVL